MRRFAIFFHPKRLPESRNLLQFLPMAARVTEILRIFAPCKQIARLGGASAIGASSIAFSLHEPCARYDKRKNFEYPQHFSRLFKSIFVALLMMATADAQTLTERQKGLAACACLMAQGDMNRLEPTVRMALNKGVTINEMQRIRSAT